MPRLQVSDVHPSTASIREAAVAYRQAGWCADLLAPVVKVDHTQGAVPLFVRSAFARDEAMPTAAGTPAARVSPAVSLSDLTYETHRYAMASMYEPTGHTTGASDFNLRDVCEQLVREKLMLAREIRVSTLLETSGNWTSSTTLADTDQWSDYDNSTPISDIRTALETVADLIGRWPDTICFGLATWRKILAHPDTLAIITAGLPAPPEVSLSNFFGLGEGGMVLGANITLTTDEEDVDESGISYTAAFGKIAWIGAVNRGPTSSETLVPSAMYSFRAFDAALKVRHWSKYAGVGDDGLIAGVEASENIDEKVCSADAGYLIDAAVA